ncbi:universal stress protein [Halolamina sp. CBA1230]|uniref:universal stress protein n=1 Tax=Halolamina sp. CBA1230 TaxID=1853690 RepID=UPI0009A1BF01|nr:universal stress protein [Halolamina sp. CBA1230]QKY20933.1 universal stress protein [Halolamina sp. CBA1230]
MFDTIVIATDGSESVQRAVDVALDFAEQFDADVYALFVVDEGQIESSPESVREELRAGLEDDGEDAVADVATRAESAVTTAVREGRPAAAISDYAREVDADVVATGTRGRHGENRYLIGGVAESVVRRCPVPVLTVRQLEGEGEGDTDAAESAA